jgi:hypothetical protein
MGVHVNLKIALISAATAIVTSLITAAVTLFVQLSPIAAEARAASQEASGAQSQAIEAKHVASNAAESASNAVGRVETKACVNAINAEVMQRIEVAQLQTPKGQRNEQVLVARKGSGCLLNGMIAGYYFSDAQKGGTNYTVSLVVDGVATTYPPQFAGQVKSYASGSAGNSGLLLLPAIRYNSELKVSYFSVGSQEIIGYALLLPDDTNESIVSDGLD